MRVALYTLGTFGDFLPLLSVARHLAAQGADVAMLGNELFEPHARAHGLAFHAVSAAAQYRQTYAADHTWSPTGRLRHTLEYHLPAIAPTYAALVRLHGRAPLDVIACSGFLYSGAVMAARALRVKCVPILLSPASSRGVSGLQAGEGEGEGPRSSRARVACRRRFRRLQVAWRAHFNLVRPHLNPIRRALGLAPWCLSDAPRLADFETCLALYPEWLIGASARRIGNLSHCGFVLGSFEGCEPRAPDDAKPIVFTMGSAYLDTPGLIELAESICCALERPGLVLVDGAHWDPGYCHSHVSLQRYTDLSQLLERAALVIHHGGMGTCAQALNAGVPQVIQPLVGDQFENASRFARLGVAVVVPKEYANALSLSLVADQVTRDGRMAAAIARHRSTISQSQALDNVWWGLRAAAAGA